MATSPPRNERMVYVQHGVFLQTSRCHRDEKGLLLGKVMLLEGKHGGFIVWDVESSTHGEPEAGGDQGRDLTVSGDAVSFKNHNDSGSVEMPVTDRKSPSPMRPFRYELSELSSYRTGDEDHSMVLVMRDGSTSSALMFQGDAMDNFVRALTKYLKIKRSKRDKNLYLVKDVREEALTQSFGPMDLFDGFSDMRGSGPALIRGLISNINEIRNDPKTAAMTTFSKLYNVVTESLQGGDDESRPAWEMAELLNQSLSPSHSNEDISCSKTSGVSSLTEQGFEIIEPYSTTLPPLVPVTRGDPLTKREWESEMIDVDGRVIEPELVKERIFRGGVEPSIRKDVWKYLLKVLDWNTTFNQRKEQEKKNLDYYYRMKFQWKSVTEDQESRWSGYRDRKALVEKDVHRTDRLHPFYQGDNNKHVEMLSDILMTYVMYNFDLGYVQGMSDLLSPILFVMGDEVDAFWCFKGFIDLVGTNFDLDQEGMKKQLHDLQQILAVVDPKFLAYLEGRKSGQLYFLFRWLLIWFKREFSFESVQRLWEVLWTGLPCKNFHMLFCVALLQTAKHTITENDFGFNEILKHVNDMSMKMDVDESLAKAEALYVQLRDARGVPNTVRLILGLPEKQEKKDDEPDDCDGEGASAYVSASASVNTSSDEEAKCEAAMNSNYF